MEASTQSNISFDNDQSLSSMLIESIDAKKTRNANELDEARFWLGQLGKIRVLYEEKLFKLAEKVEELEVENKAKIEQLQSKHEEKLSEMESRLLCCEEKCMKKIEQADEANNIVSVLKECVVDFRDKAESVIHALDSTTNNQVVDLVESDDESQSEIQYEQVEHVEHVGNVEQVEMEPSAETNNDETAQIVQNLNEQSGDGNQHDSVEVVNKENIRPQSTPIAAKNEAGPSTVKAEVPVIIAAKSIANEGAEKEAGANEPAEAIGELSSAVVVKEEQQKTKMVFPMKSREKNVVAGKYVVPGKYVKRKRILVEANDEDDEDDNDDENDGEGMVTEDGFRVVYVPMKKKSKRAKGKFFLVAKK